MSTRKTVGYPKASMRKAGYVVSQRKQGDKRIFSVFFETTGKLVLQIVKASGYGVITMTRTKYLWGDKVRVIPEKEGITAECYSNFPEGATLVERLEVRP